MASGLAGFCAAAYVIVHYLHAAESAFGKPLGAAAYFAIFPLGMAAFMIGGALFGAIFYMIGDLLGRRG